jgi:uncharacterized protein with FMN-binding domain
MNRTTRGSRPARYFRKFFVSAFVIITFVAYALHERSVSPDEATRIVVPTPITLPTQQIQEPATVTPIPTQSLDENPIVPTPTALRARPTATRHVLPTPTQVPPPTAQANGLYRDGTYTGDQADAFYGIVQVQAVVQNGKLTDVQFLEFPNDRRTSQRINSIAIPYLQEEALQAQNANVDIISGATLTSEAFIQSLESALTTAKNGS